MGDQTQEILFYSLSLAPGRHHAVGRIELHGRDGLLLQLFFTPDEAAVSPLSFDPAAMSGHAWEHLEAWGRYVDLLRNEAPIFVTLSPTRGTMALHTGREPVGDGERG